MEIVSPPVYHASMAEFDVMDSAFLGTNTGAPSAFLGFFFATVPAVAASYASSTASRLREANAVMEELAPKIKAWTGHSFHGALHRQRRGEYARKPWNDDLDKILSLYDDALMVTGEEEFDYADDVPTLADHAHLYRARLRFENPFEYDFKGADRGVGDGYHQLLQVAKAAGNDAVILRNTTDPGDRSGDHLTDIYVVFSPGAITIEAKICGEEAQAIIRASFAPGVEEPATTALAAGQPPATRAPGHRAR